ncbi:type IV pilin protein [Cognatilysobacter bugurensis]|uniref:Pilus biosynthesis protein n=1 Tax=Cognatilysobacter bugurensis TaxID=543356 RepID=A0A918SXA8_9GAMM|nr:type IV pilin protein [Lysobacter bugurensis]GHA76252.1 pilus biosynthesis protein [Lysobacter bugurensis]
MTTITPRMFFGSARRAGGFTLIELMITVAIVAILASVAMASYQGSVVKTRRGNAKACLTEVAQALERRYTTKMTYAADAAATDVLPAVGCRTEIASFYTVSAVDTLTASAYELRAVPQGKQETADTLCGTLGITNTGTKKENGTGSVSDCW